MKATGVNNIITSIASGNHQDFRTFYDIYYPKVYRFIYYFLANHSDCEIVVSDVFCIVWEKRELLSRAENVEGYLYRISRNEAFLFLKKRIKRC